MKTTIENENREYYLSTRNEKGEYLVYSSEKFRLSEIDLLNLLKMCIKDMRSKTIGNKLLLIYRDSTEHRKEITEERLTKIGIIEDEQPNPDRERKPITK
jgi:hypothetical protein